VKLLRAAVVPSMLAAGLLAVLAAGCGSAAQGGAGAPSTTPGAASLAQLLPAMQAAADSAQSVHVTGTSAQNTQTYTIDMSLTAPGNAAGSIAFGGKALTLVAVNGNAYVEITTGFLKFANISPPDCGTECGKYVAVPSSDTSQFASDLDIQTVFKQAFNSIPSSARHSTADIFVPTRYHGQPALKASIAGYTMVVARGGKPYLLQASDTKGDDLVFSEWNSVPAITPPPASDVVSPAALVGL
jgi:hypothetical protein